MSEYMFGSGNGELTDDAREQIDAIAGENDCCVINPKLPGESWRYWFAGPNRGNPFDGAMRNAVMADLCTAGLADTNGLVAECFVREES